VDRDTGEVTREWNLVCPLHQDNKRSASINIDKGVFFCNVCGGMPIVRLMGKKAEWQPAPTLNGNHHRPDPDAPAPTSKQRTLTEGHIKGWHSALLSNAGAMRWLDEVRGLSQQTIEKYEIGYDSGRIYTIPVRGPENEIWNVRFYDPSPGAVRRKIWSESGYGSPNRLYPISVFDLDPSEIVIGEGEWDILLLLQNGIPAVTRTGAADVWLAEWGSFFKDRTVYLCNDRDDKGSKADRVIARSLRHVADVRVIELPYPREKKHGKDVTDFLLEHYPSDFRELMSKARPANKRRGAGSGTKSKQELATVLDTFDAHNVGTPLTTIVTIKGRKEPGYTIPKVVQMACTQDAGNKCAICPMRAANGEATLEINADDPLVLSMIDYTTPQMKATLAGAYGVPGGKCPKLMQDITEYQSVEILFGRPALDYSDGSIVDPKKAATYKNIKITSVGRHDTASNNTVQITGALQPNPRTQGNEFLVSELEGMETSVDRFELTDQSIALMKRFQGNGRPLHKVAEINRALSEHITRVHGRPEMHAVMDLTYHSVISFNFAGEYIHRGWLESLILGDTRTGKSQAAQRMMSHYGAGEMISCEAASFAGVVGGLQTIGQKDWVVTWGVIPLNDRRLVVLDEISGLTPEEIAQMSDIRSSGQAKLVKIQQETTWARTRLLWLANPRNATMANYTYGVDAIKPLIGNAEDIARFDLAMVVTLFDVASETINQPAVGGELLYTAEACHTLLMWVWTRGANNIIWATGAEDRVFYQANEMGKLYVEDPPLIQAANVRIKLCRLAIAIAARTFSTDDSYENIVVHPYHVDAAVQMINLLYGMPSFGYRERSRERLADRYAAEDARDEMSQYLKGRPILAKYLRSAGKFRRQDLDEIMNISREESNAIISTLYEHRMVRKVLGDIVVEPTLHSLLRELKW
jgi:hypothetical protein